MSDTSVQFTLGASSSGLAAELRAASAAAAGLTAAETELAAATMRRGQVATTVAAGQTKAAGAALMSLKSQLVDVGSGLAMGQSPMMILVQQSGQLGEALASARSQGIGVGQALAQAAGGLLPIVGVMAALGGAVLVAKGAWQAYHEEAETAARVSRFAGETIDGLAPIFERQRDAALDLAEAMGQITKAEAEMIRSRRANHATLTASLDKTQEQVDALHAGEGSFGRLVGDFGDWALTAQGGIGGLAIVLDGMTTSTSEASAEIEALMKRQASAAGSAKKAIEETAGMVGKTAGLTGSRSGPRVKSDADIMAEMDRLRESIMGSVEAVSPEQLTVAERLAELMERATKAAKEGKLTALDLGILREAATAVQLRADAAERAAAAEKGNRAAMDMAARNTAAAKANEATVFAEMKTTAGKVGSAMSDPLGTAAAMHPIAQAVYAGIKAVGSMQDGRSVATDAADLLGNAMQNLGPFVASAFDAVAQIIREVPVGLIESLPAIAVALADAMPGVAMALAEAIPDVIVALAAAIPEMIPALAVALGMAIVGIGPLVVIGLVDALTSPELYEAIADAFVGGIERGFEKIGDLAKPLEQPVKDVGSWVDSVLNPNPSASTVTIKAGDLWSDFERAIGIESGAQGRGNG